MGKKLKSTKIAKQKATNENLLMLGGAIAFLGLYVIAELQVFMGLIIVFSGYGTIISTTKTARNAFHSLLLKLKKP